MIFLFRSFARGLKKSNPIPHQEKFSFEDVIKDTDFLLSIGIKHFPISTKTDPSVKFSILSEEGYNLGIKSLKEAMSLTSKDTPDLLLLETDPPLLQLNHFKKIILKKTRVAHGKYLRKHIKEEIRSIKIKNSIKSQDIALKMIKIEDFIEDSKNLLIEIPFDSDSLTDFDRAKVLANDTSNYLKNKFPEGTCQVLEYEEKMTVAFEPCSRRERLIESICRNEELFKSLGMEFEYQKIKNTFNRYKYTYRPDPEENKENRRETPDL
jgi:translation initiation factor IF-3